MARHAGTVLGMLFLAHAAAAQFTQQGTKLVATDAVWAAHQGESVAISADGNTAIVGGPGDNGVGAAWVFTRSGGVWSQQGSKLVATDAVGNDVQQGVSVAISADGNTAIVGGWQDNSLTGAAWVYTRSRGLWSQQGSKLVGIDAVGAAEQGRSVAISADGNTAIVGGWFDNSSAGAAWVFGRSGGVWSQQWNKLVATDAVGTYVYQGYSVAISADGTTAVVGGSGDNSSAGAAWVYGHSGPVWSRRAKLVGAGASVGAGQGWSVALSADGNTAILGGPNDNAPYYTGAAWVFTRSTSAVWSQQGSKLVATDAVANAWQGQSVALSADGNTAIVGGDNDNSGTGAAWLYTRSGGVWSRQGSKLVGTGAVGAAEQGFSVAISADASTVIVGGPHDNSSYGAAWVFVASDCATPWVTRQPQSQGIPSGQTATLSVTGAGATPLSYQWYQGVSGDTSQPVGTNESSFTTQALTATTSYWARVSNSCGQADSATATVSICLSITAQPQSQGIQSGQTAKLSVTAAGTTPFSYQWYQGASGDTSQPVGTNVTSFTTPALTATTSYWVRVSNSCGHADSATATVSICLSITAQPQSQGIQSGQTATLTVSAAGTIPFLYQWYHGASGDTSQPVGTNMSSFTTPALTATTSYWVRVSNSCGHADSLTAMLVVGAYAVWAPVASHNAGLNQSQWRSDLGLLNTGTATANVLITFYGSGGVMTNAVYVPAGAQSVLTDVVGQLGGSGSGAIQILSDQSLKVTARSYNQVSSSASCYAGGTQGQDYPAVTASDGLSAGQSAYLAGLSENASYRCNIGLVNTGTGSATALVELFDGAGTKLTDYTVSSLGAGQWAQDTQPFKNRAGQTAMDRGWAKITVQSGSRVFGFASVIDNITNDPTTVAMQGSALTLVVWVPVASHNPGFNGSQWRTDLGLLNTGAVTANVMMKFFYSGGSGVVTNTTSVPVGAQSILTDVVGQLGGSASGAMEILSDQSLKVTARSYNQVSSGASCYAGGTQGQDYPAVAASDGLGAGQSAYLAGLTENASYRCNIGVVNTSMGSSTVQVELFNSAGIKLTSYTVSLAAGRWAQETQPFWTMAGQTALDRGYARLTVQSGSGVFGFASVIDNTTNDPTTVAMQR